MQFSAESSGHARRLNLNQPYCRPTRSIRASYCSERHLVRSQKEYLPDYLIHQSCRNYIDRCNSSFGIALVIRSTTSAGGYIGGYISDKQKPGTKSSLILIAIWSGGRDRTSKLERTISRPVAVKTAVKRLQPECSSSWSLECEKWSGCQDLNLGPLRPERSALPSCATPRLSVPKDARYELATAEEYRDMYWYRIESETTSN